MSLDSASTPEAFAKKEVELGSGALTVSDHGSLAAVYRVYELAKKNSLIAIPSLEGYFRDDSCQILSKFNIPKTNTVPRGMDKDKWAATHPTGSYFDYNKYYHLTLGFQTYDAYLKGVKLLSKADDRAEQHGSERKPLFDWNDLEELAATKTTLGSGCLVGMVSRHLINNKVAGDIKLGIARAYFERLLTLFKDRMFVEVFPHVCSHEFVKGVFVDVTNADGTNPQVLRYYFGKTLKTDEGECKAEELADKWSKDKKATLLSVKDFRVWHDFENPLTIVNVRKQEGFVQNECSPLTPGGDVQYAANLFMMHMAKKHKLPIIPSDDSHFCDASHKIVQDVKLAQMGDWRLYGSYHRQTSQEAFNHFHQYHNVSEKEFESWVDNSLVYRDSFKDFKFDTTIQLPDKFFPQDTLAHTKKLIEKHGRFPKNDLRYAARLKQEIELFHRNGTADLLSYFFVDEEVGELYSKNEQLCGPGRGSGAGTLLAYLLGITNVDPLQYNLSLDRFLTLDRVKSGKWPDIDFDLPSRDLLLDFLDKRYGDCYAQISVMTTLKLSSAVRDVARFSLGSVPPDIETWCKQFERPPQGLDDLKFILGYTNDEGHQQGSIERDQALKAYINKYPKQWEIVKNCLALPRQRGRHASAFIIASKPISDFIPITSVSGVKVTAYTGSEVEAVGGLKMDWLVVSCLLDIQACLKLVKERNNYHLSDTVVNGRLVPGFRLVLDPVSKQFFDIWDLPSSSGVFDDISQGKTETVFQFNTNSAVQWLKCFNYKRPNGEPAINSIESMAVFTALDRPGPLDYMVTNPETNAKHNIMVEYARRVRGLPGSKDILPIFDQLLPETNSLMVYQEGLQKVYQTLTGCTGAEAEAFRSNIAKKKKEKVDAAYKFFMDQVTPKLGKEQAQEIWDSIVTFAQYGFNKSHSTAYCVISYACAWLKHYYPLEWWTSVLCNATKEEVNDTFWPYVQHIVDLPDIKLSKPNWAIVGDRIRAPIDMCYGIGEGAQKQLTEMTPYESADDFCKKIVEYKKKHAAAEGKWARSAVTIGTVYTLLVAGVLDSLFDPTLSIAERITEYERLLKKYTVEGGKKYPKSKTEYPTLDALGRYQIRKGVLPAYSEDIRGLVTANSITEIDGCRYYNYLAWDKGQGCEVWQNDKIVGFETLKDIDTAVEMPQAGYKCAIVGYVEDKDSFSYQNKTKTAKKFLIDSCGFKFWSVYWSKDGKFPSVIENLQVGSIIIATITKTDLNKGFSFRQLEVLRTPPEKEKDATSTTPP
jgi:DNA polymerase III alpha subunit